MTLLFFSHQSFSACKDGGYREFLGLLIKLLFPVPLFCILITRTITKRAVAWVESVQPYTWLDTWNFLQVNFKPQTHLFYHCSRSKQFWIDFELYWCLISNQRIRLCLENVLFGILTENTCPLLQLLNYFIIIGKLYSWDCRSKQIFPNIYGFRAKIIAKYETEEKISNKEFFKRKMILTPYLS